MKNINIYAFLGEKIEERKKQCAKLESELSSIKERLAKIEEGSLAWKDGTYNKLSGRAAYLKQLEHYTWQTFSEEEFRKWYMKENEWSWKMFKSRGEEIICALCCDVLRALKG